MSSPDTEELGSALRCWNSKLDLVAVYGNLGIEGALMVQVGVHFNARCNKLRDVDAHLCHKLHAHGWHEGKLLLQEEKMGLRTSL